jgi:hypothetical protein
MSNQSDNQEEVLRSLRETVVDAAAYFTIVDEDLCDGHQTAREVLSHLVFWHQEYVSIGQALVEGREPEVRIETFAVLNAASVLEFKDQSMVELAGRLVALQETYEETLGQLSDWDVNFPIKRGSRIKCVTERLPDIEFHISNHVGRLKRAERHGAEWVKAYYLELA